MTGRASRERNTGRGDLEGLVMRQYARAAAERGRLDPVFQDLSGQYSRMMQKLYPVWVLLGPGLSDPAHIEVHSRTIWMDSEALLGSRAAIVRGDIDSFRILVSLGVAAHEAFHGGHTKTWIVERTVALAGSDDPADVQLAVDRRLVEEPRMEAAGIRKYPAASARGRFLRRALRAAVAEILLPAFAGAIIARGCAGAPVTRDLCGEAMTYLQARVHCGTADDASVAPVTAVCERVLGAGDAQALNDFFARLVQVEDGDDDALDRCAREYRAIIGPPAQPPTGASGSGRDANEMPAEPGDAEAAAGRGRRSDVDPAGAQDSGGGVSPDPAGADGTGGGDGDDSASAGDEVTVGSLREALERAIAAGRDSELRQFDEDVDLKDLLKDAAGAAANVGGPGAGTGRPSGRMPDRGVDRPAAPDEIAAVARFVQELRKAGSSGTRTIAKRAPGGKFNGRSYIRGRAQRSMGQAVTSHPWEIDRTIRRPLKEPHVGMVVDTSGSMSDYEYALGPIVYILDTGFREFGGRMATALFGNGCELLSDGRRPLTQVPGIKTGGGTAFAGDAIELVTDELDITDRSRPRLLFILSDGGWFDTRAGVTRIREVRALGVPTIHISIGLLPPMEVEADRISVITDPADALTIVAVDSVDALRRGVPRPVAPPRLGNGAAATP